MNHSWCFHWGVVRSATRGRKQPGSDVIDLGGEQSHICSIRASILIVDHSLKIIINELWLRCLKKNWVEKLLIRLVQKENKGTVIKCKFRFWHTMCNKPQHSLTWTSEFCWFSKFPTFCGKCSTFPLGKDFRSNGILPWWSNYGVITTLATLIQLHHTVIWMVV